MKINKVERITRVEVKCNRGSIEGDIGREFVILKIPAIKCFVESGEYCYWNWHISDLKDLADGINAFLEEIKKPN